MKKIESLFCINYDILFKSVNVIKSSFNDQTNLKKIENFNNMNKNFQDYLNEASKKEFSITSSLKLDFFHLVFA